MPIVRQPLARLRSTLKQLLSGGRASQIAKLFIVTAAISVTMPGSDAQAQSLLDLFEPAAPSRINRQVVHLETKYPAGTIIVSYGDRRLYRIEEGGSTIAYPIAVPTHLASWEGTLNVTSKRVNPSWRPTPSMIKRNPMLPRYVPGGHPQNPMGVRALYLGDTLYRIHGTDSPWTIGEAVSSGCIRMYNEDVKDLYERTQTGAQVIVTWKKFQTELLAAR